MSERLSIVVPNGTIERLKLKAEKDGYTQSALGRKILLEGLKKTDQKTFSDIEIDAVLNGVGVAATLKGIS